MNGRRPRRALWLLLAGVFAGAQCLRAQVPPSLEFGFQERVRTEAWANLADHQTAVPDERSQIRFRTRLWAIVPLGKSFTVAAGLVNENKKVTRPDVAVNGREIIFETLYADWRFAPAWSVRAGRQNLYRGDGFILGDATILDGSRSAYFNALLLTWSRGDATLEAMAISDPQRDHYLPRLNEARDPRERVLLGERDEAAMGLYGTWRTPGVNLQAYAFHKTERKDNRPLTDPTYQADRWIETVGLRLERALSPAWTARGEGALQWGRQDGRPGTGEGTEPIRAWGTQLRLTGTFQVPGRPELAFGWVGLSGDDPRTPAHEGWDALFARWPQWSEAYVVSLVPEAGISGWTNLRMLESTLQLKPHAKVGLRATLMWLQAEHALQGMAPVFGSGTGRGRLLELRGDVALTDRWQGHILYERLDPGRFYVGSDPGRYFRVEALYTFRHRR